MGAVWLEADLDLEWNRAQEHQRWWSEMRKRAILGGDGAKAARGASRIDRSAGGVPAGKQAPDKADRGRTISEYERQAALWRELSRLHEDLHPILGYGVEGKTFVVVQQAAPHAQGLRGIQFTPRSCQRVLGQALKALAKLHEQLLPHGHLSPESFIVEDGPHGVQVALAWTPGQRRCEGHAVATLGFRGPGDCASEPGSDIWALACVILAWWTGFSPAPHPWTQFARSQRLQQDIFAALAEQPPRLPKALCDMHEAAMIEDPQYAFLPLLAALLTRCFASQPSDRPPATQLLQDRFFEASL